MDSLRPIKIKPTKNVLTDGVAVLLCAVVLVLLVLRIDVADLALSTTHPVPLRPHAEVTLITLCITEYSRVRHNTNRDRTATRCVLPRWKTTRYLRVPSKHSCSRDDLCSWKEIDAFQFLPINFCSNTHTTSSYSLSTFGYIRQRGESFFFYAHTCTFILQV